MAKFVLTHKAVADLSAIWNYTFDEWSEEQADKYYKMLINTFTDISLNPQIGKNYEGVASNLLGYHIMRHIIFYRLMNNGDVEITRILHDSMDLKRRLKE